MIGRIYTSWCDDCEEDVETQDLDELLAFNARHSHPVDDLHEVL